MKDLWELASREGRDVPPEQQIEERSILICGIKFAGKSTMLGSLFETTNVPNPTVALDYHCDYKSKGSGSSSSAVKDIGHIYELGGGAWLNSLMNVVMSKSSISTLSIVIMLDLSKPNELFASLENFLTAARNEVAKAFRDADLPPPNRLSELTEHSDFDMLQKMQRIFPINLTIVGGKYDLFQTMEPAQRAMIGKMLRFYAHSNGSNLLFFSNKFDMTSKKARTLLSHLLYKTQPSKTPQSVDNKPQWFPFGTDSFADIGLPPGENDPTKFRDPSALWRESYTRMFPQEAAMNPALQENPADDGNFSEPSIDKLRSEKLLELSELSRQAERKLKQSQEVDMYA